ncbi:MAG: MFS transporter [Nocardioides sp.]
MSDPFIEGVAERAQDLAKPGAGAAEVPTSIPRLLRPFRTAAYRRLALALICASFANGVWVIALAWQVIGLDGGPAQLSLVSTAAAAGILIPALAAGVVADRIPQKRILVGVATVELIGMALVALLSILGVIEVWHLAVIAFVTGMGLAFYYPAYSAWLPALVPEEDLLAVNGFEGMVRPTIGQAIGPAVAGLVVGAISPGAAFVVAAVAGALNLLALLTVPATPLRREMPSSPGQHPLRSAWHDVAEGVRYMWRTPWLLATLLYASLLVLLFMGPFEVLLPFLIKDRLGGGPRDHALALAAFGLGSALGSAAQASFPMPRRYLTYMNLMWGLGTLPLVVMGLANEVWVVIAASVVLGLTFSGPMVIWGTLLQRRVPPDLLGRVASLDFFVSLSLMPISMALAGPVSSWIGVQATLIWAGVLPPFLAVIAILWAKLPADEIAHPLD